LHTPLRFPQNISYFDVLARPCVLKKQLLLLMLLVALFGLLLEQVVAY
jgi:hypothetical protein